MKKKIWKIFLLGAFIYVLYMIGVAVWYHTHNYSITYLKDEFNVGSGSSLSDFYLADNNNDLLNLVKRKDAFLYSFEYFKKDSSLVKTSMTYNNVTMKNRYDDYMEYGMSIYQFKKEEKFKLNSTKKALKNVNWYTIYGFSPSDLSSYRVDNILGLKGNLEINSLEYFYEGNIIDEKDSLNGRLKNILIDPESFEIGFNNDQKRKIYIEPTEEKQPLSVSFYQKEDMIFVIFLSSAKNKITENSINEFIVFE